MGIDVLRGQTSEHDPQPPFSDAAPGAGTVQARVYLDSLADITTKDRYFDNGHVMQVSSAERWTVALELDRDIKVLASQVPRSWWSMNIEVLCIDKILQMLHYYILVRVHLPVVMQQNPRDEFIYSYLTCADACEAVAQRYIDFRPLIPGIFFARILDPRGFHCDSGHDSHMLQSTIDSDRR